MYCGRTESSIRCIVSDRLNCLNVNNARQFLDAIQQQITALDYGLVLAILLVGAICLDDAIY